MQLGRLRSGASEASRQPAPRSPPAGDRRFCDAIALLRSRAAQSVKEQTGGSYNAASKTQCYPSFAVRSAEQISADEGTYRSSKTIKSGIILAQRTVWSPNEVRELPGNPRCCLFRPRV